MCETFVSFIHVYGCVHGVVIIARFDQVLLGASHILTPYLHNGPVMSVLLLSFPLYRRGNGGRERLSHLVKVIQALRGNAKVPAQSGRQASKSRSSIGSWSKWFQSHWTECSRRFFIDLKIAYFSLGVPTG